MPALRQAETENTTELYSRFATREDPRRESSTKGLRAVRQTRFSGERCARVVECAST